MMSTELHGTGRFEIYDRGQLRHLDVTQIIDACKKTGSECKTDRFDDLLRSHAALRTDVDALLFAAVTNTGGGSLRLDYRLVNSNSFTVMLAGQAPVSAESSSSEM